MRHAGIEITAVARAEHFRHLTVLGVRRHLELAFEHVDELFAVMFVAGERFLVDVAHANQVRIHVTRRKPGRERIKDVRRRRVVAVGRHPALPRRERRHLVRAQHEIIWAGGPGVPYQLAQRFAEGPGEPDEHIERKAARAKLDLLEVAVFQADHARHLRDRPAAALAQRAQLASDRSRPPVFRLVRLEHAGRSPVLACGQRCGAR